jgi:hypothetical protein
MDQRRTILETAVLAALDGKIAGGGSPLDDLHRERSVDRQVGA